MNDGEQFELPLNVPPERAVAEITAAIPELCEIHRWIPRFLLALREGVTVTSACAVVGIGRTQVYTVKNRYPAFAKIWTDAEQTGVDTVVEECRRRALGGSDLLMIFYLKAHRPEVYREPKAGLNVAAMVKVDIGGQERMVESVNDLSDQEIETMVEGKLVIEGDASKFFGDEEWSEDDDQTND
jgi:hypothetical protein